MSQDSPPTLLLQYDFLGYMCIHFKCWKYRFYIKMSKKSTVFGIKFKPVIKDTECHSAHGSLSQSREKQNK